jgi:thymidine kinase
MLPYKNSFVNEIIGNSKPEKPDYLTRNEYETNVLKLDFALFFYKEPHYIFRASGAVIDNIAFEIPIIAFKHPFFENLFEQAGPIGYLCDDLKEMEQIIRKIANKNEQVQSDFLIFKSNLKTLRTYFTTQQIAVDIQNQLHL